MSFRCPGQDRANWRPEDTTEAPCPKCGARIEFMKDDLSRKCPKCGTYFGDPGKDAGCLSWCAFAKECAGTAARAQVGVPAGDWRCLNCGKVYDPKQGDPAAGIAASTAWKDVPASWRCPACGGARDQFKEVIY